MLSQVPLNVWLRSALALAALAAVVWLLLAAGSAVTPFFIGLLLFYLLAPIVNRLGAYMPRPLAILLVYLVMFGGLALAMVFIVANRPEPGAPQSERLFGVVPFCR